MSHKNRFPYISNVLPDGQTLDHDDTRIQTPAQVAATMAALGIKLTLKDALGAPANVLLALSKAGK